PNTLTHTHCRRHRAPTTNTPACASHTPVAIALLVQRSDTREHGTCPRHITGTGVSSAAVPKASHSTEACESSVVDRGGDRGCLALFFFYPGGFAQKRAKGHKTN